MRYFYDTEFLENGSTIELISIGIVNELGETYYAVNSEMPMARIHKHDWLVRNVLPHLPITNRDSLETYLKHSRNSYPKPTFDHVLLDLKATEVKPKWVIANEVRDFLGEYPDLELWAWYGAYDHVVLAQLWGRMIDLPEGIPMFTNDVRSLSAWTGVDELPKQVGTAHNALDDARHVKQMYDHIMRSK